MIVKKKVEGRRVAVVLYINVFFSVLHKLSCYRPATFSVFRSYYNLSITDYTKDRTPLLFLIFLFIM